MKCAAIVVAVLSAVASVGVRAEDPVCCPGVKIIEATLDDGGSSMGRLRRLQDEQCVANRAAAIKPFPNTDKWVKTGEGLVETIFSRFAVDLASDDSYWAVEGGGSVPAAERVAVITPGADGGFEGAWSTADPNSITGVCAKDLTWVGSDLAVGLSGHKLWYIIRAEASIKDSWDMMAEVRFAGPDVNHCKVDGVSTCRMAVVEATNDFYADVLEGLKAAETVENPFANGCAVCEPETTTTTSSSSTSSSSSSSSSSSESSTALPTTTKGGAAPITTAPIEKTTTDEESGAVSSVAVGFAHVALAAVAVFMVAV